MPLVRVREVVKETAHAHTLVLEPVADADLSYRAGQFLTLRIPTDRSEGAARCYSLCTAPGRDPYPAVTVKRVDGGYASNWICDSVREGDEIEVLPPTGVFTPKSLDEDHLLLAAGSGITPVMSILKAVLAGGSGTVHLVYANRDEASVIFADQLRELVAQHPDRLHVVHWLESLLGLPSAEGLRALVGERRERRTFICGPAAFMDLAERTVLEAGVSRDLVHVERFTSLTSDPFGAAPAVIADSGPTSELEVTLDGQTMMLAWPESNNLLDVMLANGLEAPYSCREGACSACACIVLEGEIAMDRNEVLDAADLADGIVLGCQARPRSAKVRISYDA